MAEVFRGRIAKLDSEKRLAFGWGYVGQDAAGNVVVDHSGDVMDVGSLEDVVYEFMLDSRTGNAMHQGEQIATVVESVMFTKEKAELMGVTGAPAAGWWVGMKVHSDDVWKRMKAGELGAFSIEGIGEREAL